MFFLKALSRLPFPVIYVISDIVSFFLYTIIRYRRSVSYDNISRSFPEKSRSEILKIQKASYQYLTDTFFEICKEYQLPQSELVSRVALENFSEAREILASGQPVIFLTAHTGPVEWLAHSASIYLDVPIDPAYKPVHNKTIDKFIFSIRSRYRSTPIPYKTLARDFSYRKKVVRGVGILADLEPRSRDQAVRLDFLNQPTRFFMGAERVARMFNMPVFFAAIKRTQRGYYRATLQCISLKPKELEPEQLTKKYAQCIESVIRENPHAWLWTHRRWKKKHQISES